MLIIFVNWASLLFSSQGFQIRIAPHEPWGAVRIRNPMWIGTRTLNVSLVIFYNISFTATIQSYDYYNICYMIIVNEKEIKCLLIFSWKYKYTLYMCIATPPPHFMTTIEWKTGRAKGKSHFYKHGGWYFAGEASACEFRSYEGWESLFHWVSNVNKEDLNAKFRNKKESLAILIFDLLTPDTGTYLPGWPGKRMSI